MLNVGKMFTVGKISKKSYTYNYLIFIKSYKTSTYDSHKINTY